MWKKKMPKGVYKRKPITEEHRKSLSKALMGNSNGKGKNLKNKNALGKVSREKNGNWRGGKSYRLENLEKKAKRARGIRCEVCYELSLNDFDHDHLTGNFRGWICRRCNLVLGMVKDNPVLLKNLALYLEVNTGLLKNKSILNTLLINKNAISSNDSNTQTTETTQEN